MQNDFFSFMNSLSKTYCTAEEIFQKRLIGTGFFLLDTYKENRKGKNIFSFLQKKERKVKKRKTV